MSVETALAAHFVKNAHDLNPAEAVYGVLAWLTSRKKVIRLGGSENVAPAAEAADLFCKTNDLGDPSKSWPKGLKHPKEPLRSDR